MKNKLFLFLFGLGLGIRINLIGQIALSEIFSLLYIPFINIKRLFVRHPILLRTVITFGVLLLSLILSDIINQSLPEDYLRGWATIIFSVIAILFLVNLLDKNPQYCIYYLIGFAIIKILWGGGGGEIDWEAVDETTNYFKSRIMGFANPIILIISYFLCKKSKRISLLLLFSYALFCITVDARSNSLIFFTAFFLLLLKTYKIKINKGIVFFVGLALMITGYIAYIYYVNQVLYHDFGGSHTKLQLQRANDPYNPLELLRQGRGDVFIAIEAIQDNPIIGYGSWGKDPEGKYAKLQAEMLDLDYYNEDEFIRGHSIIFTAWLWAGIGGLLAIISLLGYVIKTGAAIYIRDQELDKLMIIIPLYIELIWNFMFTPFGALRTTVPFTIALLVIEYGNLPKK